jgi:hypothetical protein
MANILFRWLIWTALAGKPPEAVSRQAGGLRGRPYNPHKQKRAAAASHGLWGAGKPPGGIVDSVDPDYLTVPMASPSTRGGLPGGVAPFTTPIYRTT